MPEHCRLEAAPQCWWFLCRHMHAAGSSQHFRSSEGCLLCLRSVVAGQHVSQHMHAAVIGCITAWHCGLVIENPFEGQAAWWCYNLQLVSRSLQFRCCEECCMVAAIRHCGVCSGPDVLCHSRPGKVHLLPQTSLSTFPVCIMLRMCPDNCDTPTKSIAASCINVRPKKPASFGHCSPQGSVIKQDT